MSARTDVRLAPHQRLSRGLKYTAVGPVDITRGVLGLSANTAQATATQLRRRYESGKLRRQLAAAAEAVAALPDTLQEAVSPPKKRRQKRRRPLIIAAAAVTVLAGGAAAFSIVRRRTRPQEPPTLPPSVEVTPKP